MKNAYHRKSPAFHNFNRRGRKDCDRLIFEDRTKEYFEEIESSKNNLFCKLADKLNDPSLAPKAYWSILNNFLGKRKIPLIPPILYHVSYVTKKRLGFSMIILLVSVRV